MFGICQAERPCFNTQPPEGGWLILRAVMEIGNGFNTQPPEGGWLRNGLTSALRDLFQHTAARRRLAIVAQLRGAIESFNTQPPEGGWFFANSIASDSLLFQHTAARRRLVFPLSEAGGRACFNTQPPEGGWGTGSTTAILCCVSTHSRPKAAGRYSPDDCG